MAKTKKAEATAPEVSPFGQFEQGLEKYQPFADLAIVREDDAKVATDTRQIAKDNLKEIEKVRIHLKEPVLEMAKRIDQQAKKASGPWTKLVEAIDSRLLEWHEKQEKARLEAEKKRREEERYRLEAEKAALALDGDEKGTLEIENNLARMEAKPIEISNATKTETATSYVIENWKFTVTDPQLVPREFLMVDEVKIGKYARTMKADAKMPGVSFYVEKNIGGRR